MNPESMGTDIKRKPRWKCFTHHGQMVTGYWAFALHWHGYFVFLLLTPWFRLEREY